MYLGFTNMHSGTLSIGIFLTSAFPWWKLIMFYSHRVESNFDLNNWASYCFEVGDILYIFPLIMKDIYIYMLGFFSFHSGFYWFTCTFNSHRDNSMEVWFDLRILGRDLTFRYSFQYNYINHFKHISYIVGTQYVLLDRCVKLICLASLIS